MGINVNSRAKYALYVMLLAIFFYGCQSPLNQPTTTGEAEVELNQTFIDGQYIVVINHNKAKLNLGDESAIDRTRLQIMEESAVTPEDILVEYNHSIAGFTATLTDEQVASLRDNPMVDYLEQDRIVQFAPPCGTPKGGPCDGDGGGGGGEDPTQEVPAGITRVNGGSTYTGSNVAWVLDSGIDLDHPDLNVDASRGFNAFTSGKDGRSLDDGDGHGTHVAGTIAAVDNNLGVVGVAAGATVVPVKVLDSRGSGSYSGVIAGVDHVAGNGSNGDVALELQNLQLMIF